jgi:hypothetical protein
MPNGNELTIYGDAGSAAEEYAAKYGVTAQQKQTRGERSGKIRER